MFDEETLFSIKDGGKGGEAFDRSVVSHSDDGLVLLNVASVDRESIVLHVVDSQKLSFLINVVHHFNFLLHSLQPSRV